MESLQRTFRVLLKMISFLLIIIIGFVFTSCDLKSNQEVKTGIVNQDSIRISDSLRRIDSIKHLSPSYENDSLEFDGLERVIRLTENINNPKSVAISPNGRHAYINNLEGMNTMIINTETFETESIIEHTGKPVEFGFTNGGRYVWISYFRLLEKGYPSSLGVERSYRYKSVVVIYDTLEQKLVNRIEVGIIPKIIAVSPDEKLVFVANWNSDDISVISTQSYEVIKTIKVGAIPRGVEFTPDGKYVYVCNFGGSTISKIDVETLEVIKTIKNVGYKPRDMVINNEGTFAYFSNFGDGYLRKLDLSTDEVVDKVKIGSEPRSVALTNNGKYIFVVNYANGTVDAISTEEFKVIGDYKADIGAVGIALTPDNKYLWVTNQSTGSIIVYKVNYK